MEGERELGASSVMDDCRKCETEKLVEEVRKEKPLMLVGISASETSPYCLEWSLKHFFTPYQPNYYPFKLLLIHAKPFSTSAIGLSGPAAAVLPYVDADVKKIADRVVQESKELCASKGINEVAVETIEGDAKHVLCEAVELYNASILVVGSHGHGAIKRAVMGSTSDYCAHHAHCSVMIVKKPRTK